MIDLIAFRCGHPKSPENTGANGAGRTRCKTCLSVKGAQWYQSNLDRCKERGRRAYRANPERAKAQARAYRLADPARARRYYDRSRYGVTREDLAQQCQVCGSTTDLHIDHDHATGKVRGRLCKGCNFGIGYFRDNPGLLRAAAEYLDAD